MKALPAGYTCLEADGAVVVVRDGLQDALLGAGIQDPARLVARAPSPEHRGRTALAVVDLGESGRAVVRALTRGGALGRVVRRTSLDPQRAMAELRVSAQAAARGAQVLEVLAAVTRRRGWGYEHGLVTREVTGARDLLTVLRTEDGRPRRRALAAAGRAIRRLHDAGVDHVDLNVKNVLLRRDGEALVIDLDRCHIGRGPAPEAVRVRNLLRLLRSWTKVRTTEPGATWPLDPLRVARTYAGGDRALLRRLVAAGRGQRFGLRRLSWRLGRGYR